MFHLFVCLVICNIVLYYRDTIFGNIENQQRAAFEAAQNSFGAFNNFPFIPNFDFRYPPYGHFNYFGPSYRAPFDMSGSNSAFAAGAIGPGFRHQVAAINPGNPVSIIIYADKNFMIMISFKNLRRF